MSDPSVEDLWAGLDSFEAELQTLGESEAPQAASTLDNIDDLLRIVKEHEDSADVLPLTPREAPYVAKVTAASVLSSFSVASALEKRETEPVSTFKSPRLVTPRSPHDDHKEHEKRVAAVKLLILQAYGDDVVDERRSTIDRVLSLAKPDSDDLDDLLQLSKDIADRASVNSDAPKLLLDQQKRLDRDNILVLEKRLAQRLVPTLPTPSSAHTTHTASTAQTTTTHEQTAPADAVAAQNILSAAELAEFDDLEREAENLRVAPDNTELLDALSELEQRSTAILKFAQGQTSLDSLLPQSAQSGSSQAHASIDAHTSTHSPRTKVDLAPVQQTASDALNQVSRLLVAHKEHERDQQDRLEAAKQQALEKAREEFAAQLEDAKRAQEAELKKVREERDVARARAISIADERESERAETERLMQEREAQQLAQLREEALVIAKRELDEERERQAQEFEEAKLDAEREAHRQSQLIVEEAFRAKMLAEARAAKEAEVRAQLEDQAKTDAREREALRSKLLAGEESQRLYQARIDVDAKRLHEEYLAKLEEASKSREIQESKIREIQLAAETKVKEIEEEAAKNREIAEEQSVKIREIEDAKNRDLEEATKRLAEAAEQEKAKLKEQLQRIKREAEQRASDNEAAMAEAKQKLADLESKQLETAQQLEQAKSKAEQLENAKERAAQVYASIEAEHEHISGQLEQTLLQAERTAFDEQQRLHQVAQAQHGATNAAILKSTSPSSDATSPADTSESATTEDSVSKEQVIRSMVDAKITEEKQLQEAEKMALLAAERQALSAEKQRAVESRLRMERASEQMRAAQKQQHIISPRGGDHSSDSHSSHASDTSSALSNDDNVVVARTQTELSNASTPALEVPSASEESDSTPSSTPAIAAAATTEAPSTHAFFKAPKESISPSEDLLSNYGPVPATSAMLDEPAPEVAVVAPKEPTPSVVIPVTPSSPAPASPIASPAPSSSPSGLQSPTISTFTRTTSRRTNAPALSGPRIGQRRESTDVNSMPSHSANATAEAPGTPSRHFQVTTIAASPSAASDDSSPSQSFVLPPLPTFTESPIATEAVDTQSSPSKSEQAAPASEPVSAAHVAPAPQSSSSATPTASDEIDALLGAMKLAIDSPIGGNSSASLESSIPASIASSSPSTRSPRTIDALDDLLSSFSAATDSIPSSTSSQAPTAPSSAAATSAQAVNTASADMDSVLADGDEAPSGEVDSSSGGGRGGATNEEWIAHLNGGQGSGSNGSSITGRGASASSSSSNARGSEGQSNGSSQHTSSSNSGSGGGLGDDGDDDQRRKRNFSNFSQNGNSSGKLASATVGSKPELWERAPLKNTLTLQVTVPSLRNRTFTCHVDETQTLASLKLFLWVEVFLLQKVTLAGTHLDYIFRAEDDDYFSDEKVRLCDTPFYIECAKQQEVDTILSTSTHRPSSPPLHSNGPSRSSSPSSSTSSSASTVTTTKPTISLFLVSKQAVQRVNEQIEAMIGYRLSTSEEAGAFRKEMHNVVTRVLQLSYRRFRIPQISPFDNVDAFLPPQFPVHLWFWHETQKETHQQITVLVRLHDSSNTIIQKALTDHPYQFKEGSESAEDYVLKLRGADDWVWSSIELISLDSVRQNLRMRRKVEVVIHPRDCTPPHMTAVLQRYEKEKGRDQNFDFSDSVASAPRSQSASTAAVPVRAYRGGNALDALRSSVAIGFDMATVFKHEERAPAAWFKSWDLVNVPLTVKIKSVDHIAFDAALFKLPKKRDALTHIFVSATLITPSCVPSGSTVPYSPIGQTARTLPELYLEESLEPITLKADLFLPNYSMIPRATKLRLEIIVRYKETETTVAWYEMPIFSFDSIVRTGTFTANCALGNSTTCSSTWPSNAVPLSSIVGASFNAANSADLVPLSNITGGPTLTFEIVALVQPVVFPTSFGTHTQHASLAALEPGLDAPSMQAYTGIQSALAALLHRPTKLEQFAFWKHRTWCLKNAKTLDLFLASVPWSKPGALQFSYLALDKYALPAQPLDAIRLLSKNHLEPRFREHAVRILHRLSDSELAEVLLQLVQSLKHEVSHDSALARFLLVRALFNQHQIGHYFYWHLKACLTMPSFRERFSLVLEVYLRYSSSFRNDLYTQTILYNKLISVASELKTLKEPSKRVPFLHAALNSLQHGSTDAIKSDTPSSSVGSLKLASSASLENSSQNGSSRENSSQNGNAAQNDASSASLASAANFQLPETFQLPISCNMIAKRFDVAKCKNLESKTLPLWLVAENSDPLGDPVYGIMKVGDDLRQDQLTLQMFALMDKLWLSDGLDLKMSCYRIIETGMECGMIEVVPNAQTNAQIQKAYGGVTAAFSDKPLYEWLLKHNTNGALRGRAGSGAAPGDGESDEKLSSTIIQDFASSCAGYCVATYILGIGDRHNDNIMITKSGHLFHIDFGRFLGNSEKFAGVSRDRAPFVFTPEFAYVMGGTSSPVYAKFVQQACLAYNIVRRNASLFTSLLAMMLQTGIPELKSEDDIAYLTDAFSLELSDEEASQKFVSLISKSLETTSTQLNFAIHIWANPEK